MATISNQSGSKVVLDGRNFELLAVASDQDGLNVQTSQGLRPHYRHLLGESDAAAVTKFLRADRTRNGILGVIEARRELSDTRHNGTGDASSARKKYQDARREYFNHQTGYVGLRQITAEEGVVQANLITVSYPSYSLLSKSSAPDSVIAHAAALGTAAILVTSDGYLALQNRSASNRLYKCVPGASVAGLMSAEVSGQDGVITNAPINRKSIVRNLVNNEGNEELGIHESDLRSIVLTGLVWEKRPKPHHEFSALMHLNISADELQRRTLEAKSAALRDHKKVPEDFLAIKCNVKNIELLLSEMHCPIPPTHAGTLLAAGHYLVREEFGLEEANRWLSRMQPEIQRNYRIIDLLVRRGTNGTKKSYDPNLAPEEQGLPSLASELERLGLA